MTRLGSMEETLQHLESLDRRYDEQLTYLNAAMVHLLAGRPAAAAATTEIANEQAVAERIDQFEQLLTDRWMGVSMLRGRQRIAYREQLDRLLDIHPQLAVRADRNGLAVPVRDHFGVTVDEARVGP
jgi:hypothetical protein